MRAPSRRLAALALLLVAGCASVAPVRVPPPEPDYLSAVIPGVPEARVWGDDLVPRQLAVIEERQRAVLAQRWREAGRPASGIDQNLLALSGGGPDGAFGAGLLVGWTEAGDRPVFDVVTGISVGALIAPFAFAGPDYDDALRAMFTEFDTADVAQLQLFAVLRGALGVADTQPLRNNIRRLVDERMVARIAALHREGKALLIGTTNIDAARPVIWNMGAIAAAGEVTLFQDVMLASASIPGAFPPVLIGVRSDAGFFQEFHVDGGVTRSVFMGPPGVERALPRDMGFPVRRTFYVIQNNALAPVYEPSPARIAAIAGRSLSALIRAQSEGDLSRILRISDAVDGRFRLAFVPPGFSPPSPTSFDRAYMRGLFEHARAMGRSGVDWLTEPPGVVGRSAVDIVLRAETTVNSMDAAEP